MNATIERTATETTETAAPVQKNTPERELTWERQVERAIAGY